MTTQIDYRSPVRYPAGWQRTPLSRRSLENNFGHAISLDDAMRYVEEEATALDAGVATIYTSYEHIRHPQMRRMVGSDSAASVLLKHDRSEVLLACDKWQTVEHNLYALHLTLRALRQIEQWGTVPLRRLLELLAERHETPAEMEAHARGDMPGWMGMLGLGPTARLEDANAVYRRRVKQAGDDAEAMRELNEAIEQARGALRD